MLISLLFAAALILHAPAEPPPPSGGVGSMKAPSEAPPSKAGESLSRDEAAEASERLWQAHVDSQRDARAEELASEVIRAAGHEMRFLKREFGKAPEGGRSLWISMHGGGGAPKEVNDQQWQNQIRLYEPAEGIYVAPRAPSDAWNLWHRPEIDALFDHLIESAVIAWGVNPDRVYLMGYSAGGDGVYQLAPRMADRFAAAAMMAGHPNDASPEGLRNLPFAIFMGGEDKAYNRNAVAKAWGERLGALQEADEDGYPHLMKIYPGLGHWMDRKDAEALPWMASHTRNAWPRTIVWKQGNTPHTRFYWLAVPEDQAVKGRTIRATVRGQTIALTVDLPEAGEGQNVAAGADEGEARTIDLLLSDALLDLDKPVTVMANGREVFQGVVPRTEGAIAHSLKLRPDPRMIATARVRVTVPHDDKPSNPAKAGS